MEKQKYMGIAFGNIYTRACFRMAVDRFYICQNTQSRRGCKRRDANNKSNKRGLNTKIHLAVDAHGMPVRIVVTEGSRNDCTQALRLISDMDAATNAGITPVIPSKKIELCKDDNFYLNRC